MDGAVVAVVEDDEAVRLGLDLVLQSWGARVVHAASYAALTTALAHAGVHPTLVLSDLLLDQAVDALSPEPLDRFLDDLGFSGPVIVITGATGTTVEPMIAERGWHLVRKPCDCAYLYQLLTGILHAPAVG